MSGNARGKLKEEMEGIHRNLDWIAVHCQKSIPLCGDSHPEIVQLFTSLSELSASLDEQLQRVYATI